MQKSIILFLFIVVSSRCIAQRSWKDSIDYLWSAVRDDTSRALLLAEYGNYYKFIQPDSGLLYSHKALALAREIKFPRAEVKALSLIGITHIVLGNDAKALQINLQASKIAEQNNLVFERLVLMIQLGLIYGQSKKYPKALGVFRETMRLSHSIGALEYHVMAQCKISEIYLNMNQMDSAMHYGQLAYNNAVQVKVNWATHFAQINLGEIHAKRDNPDTALAYFQQSLQSEEIQFSAIILSNLSIAKLYRQIKKSDSSIYYAKKSLQISQENGFYSNAIEASLLLSDIYKELDPYKALEYNKTAIVYKDSLYNQGKEIALENFTAFDEQERQYEIETAKTAYQNKIKVYGLLAGLLVFLLIAFILYRNNRQKQKANKILESTLDNLKSTQAQLIQSEKMASLGELTAGIAHEIQNPLNFINNFSDVNAELINEAGQEIDKGNINETKTILSDIKVNEEKINHHGKRADAIVKGMLQHSRTSTGIKEPTDINALAEEYLRLAYHGLRAKDNSFNVTMKTDFDKTIGNINIIPQDIGRALLNLYTNAFYAVVEKSKQQWNGFQAIVSVNTKKTNGKVEIRVKDNGNGIPDEVLDKIFQPFFTTKPAGQGTGLGLSLSYDIVKAHGGEIDVNTKKGEGAEFIIQLSANTKGSA